MAPTKQPETLQKLCLERGCQIILDYSFICQNHIVDDYGRKFQGVLNFLKLYIPTLLQSNFFHSLIKKMSLYKGKEIQAEMIITFMKALVSPQTQYLSFSDLIYAGSVSYDVLDSFDLGIGNTFPYLPRLTHLDLSTHKCEVSLPSSSYNILESVGQNCPNLRSLNLNNNNRVTDDCLRSLAPKRHYHHGCPLLEEIYIQECSITRAAVIWLLKTFHRIQKVGYSDMGTILKKYMSLYRRRYHRPTLSLTYIDNSESTYIRSDRGVIHLISEACPQAQNVKIRVCDQDCLELYKLEALTKLELRFYTGVHHPIGAGTLNYLRSKGSALSCLTIFCNELTSSHVRVLAKSCVNLHKLFLHSNVFRQDRDFDPADNRLRALQVLSLRVGQHEMDECRSAAPLVHFFASEGTELAELYLLLICPSVDHQFFEALLAVNVMPKLRVLIYDAPRRNRDLPVIPLFWESAFLLVSACPSLATLGNLISWQVTHTDVCHLRDLIREKNLEVEVIYSVLNKMNTKYF